MRPAASRSGGAGKLWRLAAAADIAEWESGAVQTRLVRHWCEAHGLTGAQIYRPGGGPVASWGVLGRRETGLEHDLVLYYTPGDEAGDDAESTAPLARERPLAANSRASWLWVCGCASSRTN